MIVDQVVLTIVVIGDRCLMQLHWNRGADTPEWFTEFIKKSQSHDAAILETSRKENICQDLFVDSPVYMAILQYVRSESRTFFYNEP